MCCEFMQCLCLRHRMLPHSNDRKGSERLSRNWDRQWIRLRLLPRQVLQADLRPDARQACPTLFSRGRKEEVYLENGMTLGLESRQTPPLLRSRPPQGCLDAE